MKAEEFTALAAVERDHWFYRGKRDIVRHWLSALAPLRSDDVFIDVGAGNGQFLSELAGVCRALGVEPSPQGLGIAARRPVDLVQGEIERLPVASDRAAAVAALDVLEHLEDDAQGLSELIRVARRGGLILINVPAFQSLWSDWDESLGHRRRYTKRSLLRTLRSFDVAVLHCAYVNTVVFLPVLLYRALRRAPARLGDRLEDRVPARWLNALLYQVFVRPACWPWFSPPFGMSVFCVLRKGREHAALVR